MKSKNVSAHNILHNTVYYLEAAGSAFKITFNQPLFINGAGKTSG